MKLNQKKDQRVVNNIINENNRGKRIKKQLLMKIKLNTFGEGNIRINI